MASNQNQGRVGIRKTRGVAWLAAVGAVIIALTSFASAQDGQDGDSSDAAGSAPAEPSTFEEAQKVLDPNDEPGLLLHQLKDGSWTTLNVDYLGGLPENVKTSQDFTEFGVREQFKQNELPENADFDRQVESQQADLSCVLEDLADGEEPGETPPVSCETAR